MVLLLFNAFLLADEHLIYLCFNLLRLDDVVGDGRQLILAQLVDLLAEHLHVVRLLAHDLQRLLYLMLHFRVD